MGMWIGKNRKARVTYGFDEISLVPGTVTINPNEVDITFAIPRKSGESIQLNIPILASAMDGVVDVCFAKEMGLLGGLAVLNLEGIQTRYETLKKFLMQSLGLRENRLPPYCRSCTRSLCKRRSSLNASNKSRKLR